MEPKIHAGIVKHSHDHREFSNSRCNSHTHTVAPTAACSNSPSCSPRPPGSSSSPPCCSDSYSSVDLVEIQNGCAFCRAARRDARVSRACVLGPPVFAPKIQQPFSMPAGRLLFWPRKIVSTPQPLFSNILSSLKPLISPVCSVPAQSTGQIRDRVFFCQIDMPLGSRRAAGPVTEEVAAMSSLRVPSKAASAAVCLP